MDIQRERDRVQELAAQAAENEGFELVSLVLLGRGRRKLVRATIDKEGGVTVGDCERMSRSLEALLDVEDPIEGSYVLEVSSPGLDRPLTSQRDFSRHLGRLARVITREKIENQTFFVGRIIDVGDDWIRLRIERKEEAHDIFIPIAQVSKARLEIEIGK